MPGPLALVGGGEFSSGCLFDRDLLEATGASEVLVLPTGAAYEHPGRLVERAVSWFSSLGAKARGIDVLRRPDALNLDLAAEVRAAPFLYLAGESPMHVRQVLKDTPVWEALLAAWDGGAALAASGGGAMVLCDPMIDPRGGAFTVGLGLLANLSVIPTFETWSEDAVHRTRRLSPKDLVIVGIPTATALVRAADVSTWRSSGVNDVTVFAGGNPATLEAITT
jgi:cyanophycinase